jgi:DNA-binding NtrC family response regulator
LATNENLEKAVEEGRFRQDLFYRINVIHLELPSLRERPADIPLLVEHFLQKTLKDVVKEIEGFSPAAMEAMVTYGWPGNIRELENVISSASIFAEGPEIELEAFGHVAELRALIDSNEGASVEVAQVVMPVVAMAAAVAAPVATAAPIESGPLDYYSLARKRDISLKDLRHEVEMQCIKRALEDANGNISEAARLLKMKRSRLSQIVNGEVELKEVAHGDE